MTLEEKLAMFERYADCGFTEIDYVLNQRAVDGFVTLMPSGAR